VTGATGPSSPAAWPVSVRYPGSPADRAVSGSCPGEGAGSSPDHVDLAGPLPVTWAISFGDHNHSRTRETLASPPGDTARLTPAGLPSTRATPMARLLTRRWAALQPPASRLSAAITLDRIQRYICPICTVLDRGRAAVAAAHNGVSAY